MEHTTVSTVDEMIAGLEATFAGEQALATSAETPCTFGCGSDL